MLVLQRSLALLQLRLDLLNVLVLLRAVLQGSHQLLLVVLDLLLVHLDLSLRDLLVLDQLLLRIVELGLLKRRFLSVRRVVFEADGLFRGRRSGRRLFLHVLDPLELLLDGGVLVFPLQGALLLLRGIVEAGEDVRRLLVGVAVDLGAAERVEGVDCADR